MQDSSGVRGGQPVGHSSEQLHDLPPARLLALRPVLQRAAIDELGDDILAPFELPDVMHRQNVRMVQRRGHLRLALEPPARRRVRQFVGQNLDRHGPVELGVERPVDGAHAALAELRLNAIGADLRPGSQGLLTRIVCDTPLVGVHGVCGSLRGFIHNISELARTRLA